MDKRAAKLDYKLSHRPMGIFQIRNLTNEKVFVCSTPNLDAVFNRHKFQLNAGGHPSKPLQKDWNELGEENFVFEILEELPQRDDPNYDYAADWKCSKTFGSKSWNRTAKTVTTSERKLEKKDCE